MARGRALQFLFGLDFTQYDWEPEIEGFWELHPSRPSVRRYAETLIRGVCTRQEEIDACIGEALENWTLDRVGYIERAILRMALYEMRYRDDVPTTVAINEAVELAKQFGAEDASRFVNGVLDRLRKHLEATS
jgi:transcription antitermination protein NusB